MREDCVLWRPNPSLVGTSTLLTTPEKSANDKKDYRAIRYTNRYNALYYNAFRAVYCIGLYLVKVADQDPHKIGHLDPDQLIFMRIRI